jgi:putative transposase
MLIFGQRHLRRVLTEYATHYNQQRPHRGQQLRPPSPHRPGPTHRPSQIVRHQILGGLINEYHLAA